MDKILGVDLDEVLSETIDGVLQFHNYQINGIPASRNDITDYYIFNIDKYKLTQEEAIIYFRSFLDEAQTNQNILPVSGAKEKLSSLKNAGWKIIIVTARREKIKDATIQWLTTHFGGLWDEILFANHFSEQQINKSELCKQQGIRIMIEDNLDYAQELASFGITVYLLDKPWNQHYNPLVHLGIHKVYSWDEIPL